jgi:hypothetical protein
MYVPVNANLKHPPGVTVMSDAIPRRGPNKLRFTNCAHVPFGLGTIEFRVTGANTFAMYVSEALTVAAEAAGIHPDCASERSE